MTAVFDLLTLLFMGLGVVGFGTALAAALGARRNQDPSVPPGPFAWGRHGLTPEGREYALLFWKAIGFAVGMVLLGILTTSLGGE